MSDDADYDPQANDYDWLKDHVRELNHRLLAAEAVCDELRKLNWPGYGPGSHRTLANNLTAWHQLKEKE